MAANPDVAQIDRLLRDLQGRELREDPLERLADGRRFDHVEPASTKNFFASP
jgi:hypothetical protein